METHNHTCFPNTTVDRICKVNVLKAMHKALLNKGDVTIGELVQLTKAIEFAEIWNNRDEAIFFRIEEVDAHCNAVLNIADRHFPAK